MPEPTIENGVMRLSCKAASNMAVMSAAQAEADSKSLTLGIEPLEQAPLGNGVPPDGE